MDTERERIVELVERGLIPGENIREALRVASVAPTAKAWRVFIDRLLLWVGSLALVCAVVFFIAYNWDHVGRFTRFGAIETLIVLAVAVYCLMNRRRLAAGLSLLAAGVLTGVLLALYGQVYQTGADTWQLFFAWALLILPWVIISRFPAMWMLWIALLNLSIILYYQAFGGLFGVVFASDEAVLWLLFAFNTMCLVAWELLARVQPWLTERWAVRLLATAGGVAVTLLVLDDIMRRSGVDVAAGALWLAWLAGLYVAYRKLRPDLFMLAGGCLSGIVVVVTLIARHVLDDYAVGFLLLALVVIGLGAGAAVWLKSVHRAWQS